MPSHWETVIADGDAWRYLVPASEPDPRWREPGFGDAGWTTGATGIGYGDGDDRTQVPAGTISVYARKVFSVADPAQVLAIHLDPGARFARLDGNMVGHGSLRPAFGGLRRGRGASDYDGDRG